MSSQLLPDATQILSKNEDLYHLLVKNLPEMATVVFDKTLRFLAADGPFLKKLGFVPEQMIGRTIWEVFSPETCELLVPYYRAALEGKETSFERQIESIFYRARIVPVRNESGHIYAGMVVSQNITEQKQVEVALQESEQRYRSVFENSLDGILLTKSDGTILMANSEACRIYGRSEQELIAIGRGAVMDPNDLRLAPALEERQRTGTFRGELTALRRDGTPFPIELLTRIFSTEDGISLTSMVIRDISESKRVEQALRDSEERFRQLAERITQVFWLISVDNAEVFYISPAYEEIWGRSCVSFYKNPHSFIEAIHPEDREQAMAVRRRTIASGEYDNEYRIIRPDGSIRWIRSRAFPVLDCQGNVYRIAGISEDITERKQAEKQTLQLSIEKMRMDVLTDFIGNTSHEFRTPLAIIKANVYLAKRVDNADLRQNKMQQIEQQVQRITKLVDSLLHMAKLEGGEPSTVSVTDIKSIVEVICHQMRQEYGDQPSLDTQVQPNLPPVIGDYEYLVDAFKEILDNAYRFTPKDGTITVTAAVKDKDVVVAILDTGPGISAEALPHIFETFWRQDEAHSTPGFGLGLSIALKIVQMYGGRIEVFSKVGSGSNFCILLPIATSEVPPGKQKVC